MDYIENEQWGSGESEHKDHYLRGKEEQNRPSPESMESCVGLLNQGPVKTTRGRIERMEKK